MILNIGSVNILKFEKGKQDKKNEWLFTLIAFKRFWRYDNLKLAEPPILVDKLVSKSVSKSWHQNRV